jgi:hypothetical protein
MFPWVARVAAQAESAEVVELMLGWRMPLALSRMFPWVARVAAQAESAEPVALMLECQTPLALTPLPARAMVRALATLPATT